ncbi:M23 family metallopeptidase, partial [Eubacterium callanderi]|uniref:M23 family metallopeptidase n=1 Tax=Eubacterium callanderi TaxID=53442 RepID=UPI0021091D1A
GHLSSIDVSKGQSVRQGQHVGAVSTTGTSTGNHLHLSFLVNGNYVDPLNYMHW